MEMERAERNEGDSRGKRIDSMRRKAEHLHNLVEDSVNSDERLPPGQSLVRQGFPVLDLGEHPVIATGDWRLKLDFETKQEEILDWEKFSKLPVSHFTHDIHCVTAWSVFDARFSGPSTQALRGCFSMGNEVTHVLVHGADGYSANLEISDFLADGALLATHLNDEPLSVSHGGPLRLVIPHLYFWKSPKWITRIEFLSADKPGFWEQRGYHNRGNPWKQERYGKPHLKNESEEPVKAMAPIEILEASSWKKFLRGVKKAMEYL